MQTKLYDILKLSPNASELEVRAAYRQLAAKYHLDKNMGLDDNFQYFANITRAYAILSDKDKRKSYDQGLINDHGEVIDKNVSVQHSALPGLFSRGPHKISRFKEYGLAREFPSDLPFFQPRQAYYLFFNSHEEAYSFQALKQVSAPVHVYITSASLGLLCSRLKLAQEKPIYHHKRENQPAHVLVKTNYFPRIECLIDALIKEMFLLELSAVSKNISASSLAMAAYAG